MKEMTIFERLNKSAAETVKAVQKEKYYKTYFDGVHYLKHKGEGVKWWSNKTVLVYTNILDDIETKLCGDKQIKVCDGNMVDCDFKFSEFADRFDSFKREQEIKQEFWNLAPDFKALKNYSLKIPKVNRAIKCRELPLIADILSAFNKCYLLEGGEVLYFEFVQDITFIKCYVKTNKQDNNTICVCELEKEEQKDDIQQ